MNSHVDWSRLPQAAGLCSLDEAARTGLSVDACVSRMKRYHFVWHRLWRIFLARLTNEPIYEVKMVFSHHAYLSSENQNLVRNRITEMRHPPLGLDKVPDDHLEILMDEIESVPAIHGVISGVYSVVVPELIRAVEAHVTDSNPLADAPGIRLSRIMLMDLENIQRCGDQLLAAFQLAIATDAQMPGWIANLRNCLTQARGICGQAAHPAPAPIAGRLTSTSQVIYNKSPRRDHRFPDPYNMGVHAEAYLYNESYSPVSKTLMMYFKRLREIDVPEMMASILVESPGRDAGFYRDMTRQLWDEARHAIMGEVGFHKLGIHWPDWVRVNFTWSLGLNEQLTPQERHAVLWFIEQGLMNKTGKRYEWEVARLSGDSLAALFQDYDWADEVLHARIGRDWYVKDFSSLEEASHYGSDCWSKVVSNWDQWAAEGLTQHENWWPGLYNEFCRLHGIAPHPDESGFCQSYKETRADLQRIHASG